MTSRAAEIFTTVCHTHRGLRRLCFLAPWAVFVVAVVFVLCLHLITLYCDRFLVEE